jgi:hypothetical protein
MNKVFSKNIKEMLRKILVAILIIFTLQQLAPREVHASASFVGKLTEPFVDLLVDIGDGIVNLAHNYIVDQDNSKISLDISSDGWNIFKFIGNIVVGVFVTAVILGSSALLAPVVAAIAGFSLIASGYGGKIAASMVEGVAVAINSYPEEGWEKRVIIPQYTLSPETIFQGRIPFFDVDFFNKNDRVDDGIVNKYNGESENNQVNIAEQLRPTIANWYNILRNIAIVAMMSILVYIGIRILISSTAENKAKYKQLLVDWAVGMCLLFVIHYGMAFANLFVNKLTNMLSSIDMTTQVNGIEYSDKIKEAIEEYNEENGSELRIYGTVINDKGKTETLKEANTGNINEANIIVSKDAEGKLWATIVTNYTGSLRMNAEYARSRSEGYLAAAFLFVVSVILLIYFVWVYLKRVLYMAFLTLIAPFVAMFYAIDKVKDGRAQTLDFWLKEYIYNLLLQPFHLILYTVLVGSALQLFAAQNYLYSVVAVGFISQSEKLLRQMFGFKGSTPGSVPSAAGGALMMGGMRKLLGLGPKEKNSNNSAGGSKQSGASSLGKSPVNRMATLAGMYGDEGDNGANISTPIMPGQEENSGVNIPTSTTSQSGTEVHTSTPSGILIPTSTMTRQEENSRVDITTSATSQPGTIGYTLTSGGVLVPTETMTRQGENSGTNIPAPVITGQGENPEANVPTPITAGQGRNDRIDPPKFGQKLRRGLAGASQAYASNAKRNVMNTLPQLKNSVKKMKPARFVGGAAVGGMAATLGAAIGVASGGPKDALTNASVGGLAGWKAGRGIGSTTEHGDLSAREGFLSGYRTQEEQEQKERHERYKQAMNDPAYMNALNKNFKREEISRLTKRRERGSGRDRRNTSDLEELMTRSGNKIPEANNIVAMSRMILEKGKSADEAIAIGKTAETTGDFGKKGQQDTADWMGKIKDDFKNYGLSENAAEQNTQSLRKDIDSYHSYKGATKQ